MVLVVAGCGSSDEEPASDDAPVAESTSAEPGPDPAEGPDRPKQAPEPELPPVGDGRGGVELVEIGSFEQPVFVTSAGSEGADLYVVEQSGRIIRVSPDGSTDTFLDISDQITVGGEQGLLSVAFAPSFPNSGRFYVNLTDTEGDTRVVEYRSPDGREVDLDSRRELLRLPQPFANHNGGLLLFGPDGMLYIGTGDGGSGGDPERNAQDRSSLLGKILRIDPRGAGGRPYRVPSGNPFASDPDARGEIYAYGLRNPWRYSFDRETGALTIGDVGQDSLEEIDLVSRGRSAGANFGWSAFEGDERFNGDQEAPGRIAPALTYPTDDGNCSVTGGYVVRDERLGSLYGRYLYGDFCGGELRSFPARPGRAASGDRVVGVEAIENLSSFGSDHRGRIYATSLNGPVYRLDPS